VRLLHVSDLHFGRSSVKEQVEGVERMIAAEPFDAIVISGDLTQRTRRREFERARRFVELCMSRAAVLVVPGNHDTAWWTAPMGIGSVDAMHTRYRAWICADLEPQLRLASAAPGATIVGLNSSHGVRAFTMTTRPRDISVVGALRREQWEKARKAFEDAPRGDLKVLVMHHNLLRGDLSRRWGLANRAKGIASALETGADLVLCGHDHQADSQCVDVPGHRMVVSCASTLTTRTRGRKPGSFNVIEVDGEAIQVNVLAWNSSAGVFERAMWARYSRQSA
jgi:3',5'-cyclic AMP phosphodiesterase CpdA